MYVLRPNNGNLAFIAHPRTASRSCSKSILAAGGTSVAGHHLHDENQCVAILQDGGTVACVKRNMFDIMVSWWHNQVYREGTNILSNEKNPDFPAFVREKAYHCQHRWFIRPIYHYGLHLSNHVIRYENLEQGMRELFQKCGIAPRNLIVEGKSKRTDYRDYYDDATRAIVAERWAADLELTGYDY